MAHTDRQPSDEIFKDIKQAAERTWVNTRTAGSDWDYIEEKIKQRQHITNYADNWCGFIQQFDSLNQIVFFDCLEYQESVDFLVEQHAHYSYFLPRVKKTLEKEVANFQVYTAIDKELTRLGLANMGGGDNDYGIGTQYVYEPTGYNVEVTISNP
jgi:hypothetical protein